MPAPGGPAFSFFPLGAGAGEGVRAWEEKAGAGLPLEGAGSSSGTQRGRSRVNYYPGLSAVFGNRTIKFSQSPAAALHRADLVRDNVLWELITEQAQERGRLPHGFSRRPSPTAVAHYGTAPPGQLMCVRACLCACVCACVCARVYGCTCMCVCMCVGAHACVHVCACMCVHMCACVRVRACVCAGGHYLPAMREPSVGLPAKPDLLWA